MDDISLAEIRTLAREMTLKFSFIGLARGGAKSGIRLPAGTSPEEKRRLLGEFGRSLAPIVKAGIYFPGMDMNCGPDDLRALYGGAGLTLGKITDTSYFTAISVANAIFACRELCNPGTRKLTVAIEGFGSVGAYLAERLPEDQFSIVAVSTVKGAVAHEPGFSATTLVNSRKEHGDGVVHKLPQGSQIEMEEVLSADVDILVPAARILALNEGNMTAVRARYIVPVANAPYTRGAMDFLQAKGITCLPGFVTNSGGVYASSLYDSGVPVHEIERISASRYRQVVVTLLRKSLALGRSPIDVAEEVAANRLAVRQKNPSTTGISGKLVKRLFQKGLVPGRFYGRSVLQKFVDNLVALENEIGGRR